MASKECGGCKGSKSSSSGFAIGSLVGAAVGAAVAGPAGGALGAGAGGVLGACVDEERDKKACRKTGGK
jgi:outer membrane lipoprotein SlyB